MKMVVVSPHRDDAAFSCGIFLNLCVAAHAEVTILNIFTRSAYAPFAGPSSIPEISQIRKEEDLLLKGLLGESISFVDLGMDDAPLRFDIDPRETLEGTVDKFTYSREIEALQQILQPKLVEADCFLLPLGLGNHIDHLISRDAGRRCDPLETVAFYEDLPYAARLGPARRAQAVQSFVSSQDEDLKPIVLQSKDGENVKRQYAACYPSQVDAATVEEMVSYSYALGGGETFYAGHEARRVLTSVVPSRMDPIIA